MNRRLFLSAGTALLTASLLPQAQAAPFAFEEGVHYKKLPDNARSLVARGTVQEFFFYGCPHCYHMEKPLHNWLDTHPKGIHFEQIPAVFQNPAWGFLARVYYALKATNQLSLHDAVFELFINDHIRPKNQQEFADIVEKKYPNFNKADFLKNYDDAKINEDVARAGKLSGQYQLDAVPTFVINGHYVTDLPMAGDHAKLFTLIEQLANQ